MYFKYFYRTPLRSLGVSKYKIYYRNCSYFTLALLILKLKKWCCSVSIYYCHNLF